MIKMKDLTPEGKRFFQELEKLQKLEVKIGFQSGEADYEDGTDLVSVAAYNEFGDSNTPARPFMKQSFEANEDKLRKQGERSNIALSNGASAEDVLKEFGVFAKGLIQEEIVEGGFAPNAPSTVRRKGSDQPLIDTGHMRQSVNYVIKSR